MIRRALVRPFSMIYRRYMATAAQEKMFNSEITCAGKLSKDQMEAVVCSKRFKTWIYLCEDEEEGGGGLDSEGMAILEAAAESGSIQLVHLPLRVNNLSTHAAYDIYEIFERVPKPIFMSCGNALRSHATKTLCEAMLTDESCKDTFERIKDTKSGGILKSPHIVQWLIGSIDGLRKSPDGMFCRQLFDKHSSSFTYIVACQQTREAVIIDPVLSQHERDLNLIEELELHLLRAIDTHVHEDRFSGIGAMHEATLCETSAPKSSKADCTDPIDDGTLIKFGEYHFETWSTPGHTPSCLSLVLCDRRMIFTGDTLLVRDCGRTDLNKKTSGSDALFNSIHSKIMTLPMNTLIYPAHDFEGFTASTIGEERANNPFLDMPVEEFSAAMTERYDPSTKPIDMADNIRYNMKCGRPKSVETEGKYELDG